MCIVILYTMQCPSVAIVIVNWNNPKDTVECIDSVMLMDYSPLDIIIVDNGSSDGSAEKISDHLLKTRDHPLIKEKKIAEEKMSFTAKEIPNETNHRIHLIESERNDGPTGGNNIGIYYSMRFLDPSYFILLNNDTVVDKHMVENLITHMSTDKDIAITQAKILMYSDINRLQGVGNKLDIFGTTLIKGVGEEDSGQYDDCINSDFFYAAGTCMMMRRRFVEMVGEEEFFDQALFGFQEDVDISWIARLLGWKITYCPEARCYHKWGQSFAMVETSRKYFYNKRNQIRLLLKNYQLTTILFVLPVEFCILTVSNLILSFGKDRKYFGAFLKAIKWNVSQLPDTIKRREMVQMKRRLPDRVIIKRMDFKSFEVATFIMLLRNT